VKVIVGLGNPGPRYRGTRHNVGFMTVDEVAARLAVAFDREKYQGLVAQGQWQGAKVLLLKPMTYMNLSGQAVAQAVRNAVDSLADLLVVADDVNLPLGRLRFRREGSAGGHNGLKSIIERVGTQEFSRLRIGVGENRAEADLVDHVLGVFTPEERVVMAESIARAADAVLAFVAEGMDKAMNRFH